VGGRVGGCSDSGASHAHIHIPPSLPLPVPLPLPPPRPQVLVFVNSADAGMRVRLFLEAFGIRASLVNAELPLNSRHHILQVCGWVGGGDWRGPDFVGSVWMGEGQAGQRAGQGQGIAAVDATA
jgi:hypothetical protein